LLQLLSAQQRVAQGGQQQRRVRVSVAQQRAQLITPLRKHTFALATCWARVQYPHRRFKEASPRGAFCGVVVGHGVRKYALFCGLND